MSRRLVILVAVLAVTLAIGMYLPGPADIAAPLASASVVPNSRHDVSTPAGALTLPDRSATPVAPTDAFAVRDWAPPPPRVSATLKPVAPPVPYVYIGRMTENGRALVFLSAADRVHAVGQGDVIDTAWRVDAIGEDAITLTFLPAKARQTINTGAAR